MAPLLIVAFLRLINYSINTVSFLCLNLLWRKFTGCQGSTHFVIMGEKFSSYRMASILVWICVFVCCIFYLFFLFEMCVVILKSLQGFDVFFFLNFCESFYFQHPNLNTNKKK